MVSLSNQKGSFTVGKKKLGDQKVAYNGYLVSFDKSGKAEWVYSIESDGVPTSIDRLAIDPRGKLLVLAHWSTALCEQPCRLLGRDLTGTPDGFILQKLQPGASEPIWTRVLVGGLGGDLVTDRRGNVLATALFRGELRSDELGLAVQSARKDRGETFMVELSPDGKLVWSHHAPQPPGSIWRGRHLLVDRAGSVWTTRRAIASPDAPPLLSRLDPQGQPVFTVSPRVERAPEAPEDAGIQSLSITDHPDGSLTVLGVVKGVEADVGGARLAVDSRETVFVASFTSEGVFRFARVLEGCGDVAFEDMVGLSEDRLAVAGGSADFGAMMAIWPRDGAPMVFRQPLSEMQLASLTRTGDDELLVVGSKQAEARFEYRLLARGFALAKPSH